MWNEILESIGEGEEEGSLKKEVESTWKIYKKEKKNHALKDQDIINSKVNSRGRQF